jgi:hypothetical protein
VERSNAWNEEVDNRTIRGAATIARFGQTTALEPRTNAANDLVTLIADTLKEFDASGPVFKAFKPGLGPFGLLTKLKELLTKKN